MKLSSRLTIIIVILLVVVPLAFGLFFLKSMGSDPSQSRGNQNQYNNQHQQGQGGGQASTYQAYGAKTPFYSQDGISLQHSWPGEGSFSNEETEVLLFNESDSQLQVKSFVIDYQVEGKSYQQKSGTWEKFPSIESWDKIEYIMISPQYYKGEPLILEVDQKGKLHWHMQFGPTPLNGKQIVNVKLTLLKDGKTVTIDEQFTRDAGTVFSKDSH